MKIIFLDMDGVIATSRASMVQQFKPHPDRQIDPIAIGFLNMLCEYAKAKIVVSSIWRINYTKDEFITMMRRNGFTGEFHDDWCTKRLMSHFRGDEVEEWLYRHPEITKYVILDDDSDFHEDHPLVKTQVYDGLTHKNMHDAFEILCPDSNALVKAISAEFAKYHVNTST